MAKTALMIICLFFGYKYVNAQKLNRPNIIFFLVDDMGWQDTSLPFWEKETPLNRKFSTPNMERLAKMGIKMTNAYVNPVCTPTRVSLMTGANEARTKVTNWTSPQRNTPTDYPDSLLSPPKWNCSGMSPQPNVSNTFYATPLPQILSDNGYYSLHVGKAHFASYQTLASEPKHIGFTENIGGSAAGSPGSYLGEKNYRKSENDTIWGVGGLEKYHGSKTFLSEALTIEALDKLKKPIAEKQPFFLYMAHYAVHLPFDKDERFYDKYRNEGLDDTEAKYASLIEGMDKSLGDILDYIEEMGVADNTYIFFLSDNGGLSLVPQRSGKVHSQNLPLKQGKGSLYEGGIRVPMIAAGPGIEQGVKSDQYLGIDDFFPTLLSLAKIKNYKTVQQIDGENMAEYLMDKEKRDQNKALLWHYPNNWYPQLFHGISFVSAFRKGDYKMIYFHRTQELELYNLSEDIQENNNLIFENRKLAAKMAKEFTRELKSKGAQMPVMKENGKEIPYPDEVIKVQLE